MGIISQYFIVDLFILSVAFWALLYKFFTRKFDYWKDRNVPFINPQAFFGNFKEVVMLKTVNGEHIANLYNRMKTPFFGIFVLDKPVLMIKDPELVKCVLVRDFDYFYDRSFHTDVKNEPLLAYMLFFSKNPDWRVLRTKMTPVFTSGKLKNMLLLMNEVGDELQQHLVKNCLTGECVEAKEIISRYTTDVISSCAFGINSHALTDRDSIFRRIGKRIFEPDLSSAVSQICHFFAPEVAKLFKMKMFDTESHEFLENSFNRVIAERENSQIKRNDLIDIIIQMKKQDDFRDKHKFEGVKVVAQPIQFFIAGFETTASAITYTIYELCLNQQLQEKARQEINSSMLEHGGCTYEALQNMKFLHQCILEALRKYPAAPVVDRKCMANYKVPGSNFTLEKDTTVFISVFGLHYDPKYFPEPHKYDPDRFSDDYPNKHPPYTFLPFGEGPRICIGERFAMLSAKSALAHILSEFEVLKGRETPDKIDFEPKSITLASKVGIPVIFKKILK